MAARTAYLDWTHVPTVAITLPLELPPPDGFAPDDLATWWEAEHGPLTEPS